MENLYDVIIVGAGPAGMTAAIYAARKLLKTLVVAPEAGGMTIYASQVDNYLGFHVISGFELAARFEEHLGDFPVEMVRDAVASITRVDGFFRVATEGSRAFVGRSVVYAAGTTNRKLGLEGEDRLTGKGIAYCVTCDAPSVKGLPVAIVGGGNTALAYALLLAEICPRVLLIDRSEAFSADEIYRHKLLLWPNIELRRRSEVSALHGGERLSGIRIRHNPTGAEEDVTVDGLFVEIGLIPNTGPVKGLVELNGRGEILTDCDGRTSVPLFFAAGDVSAVSQKQIIIAAGEGAKAALNAYQALMAL